MRQWSLVFSEYRFSTGEAGARLFQMAIKFTKRGPIIWDHIDLDERNQPILFKRQVKSLGRRVWGYTWQTLAALIIFCLIGGIMYMVVQLLASSADQGI